MRVGRRSSLPRTRSEAWLQRRKSLGEKRRDIPDGVDRTENYIPHITRLFEALDEFPVNMREYVAAKAEWLPRIHREVLQFVPDFRDRIVFTDFFTPRTIKQWTGHLNGAVYGMPGKIKTGRTHLENLFICGNDQGFLGIVGAMLSGISMANLHVLKKK